MTNNEELFDDSENPEEEIIYVSKSHMKREMESLQALGKKLIDLNEGQRLSFALPEDLENAIIEYKRIAKNEAKRRQMQYIGKLMRKADYEGIAEKFEAIEAEQSKLKKSHHLVEAWRDKLITGNQEHITAFMDDYPHIDRQSFRQLTRNAVKEQEHNKVLEEKSQSGNKKTTATRKLFQFIRDNMFDSGH